MDKFEQLILRWVSLFDDFKNIKYSNIKSLVSSLSFKTFVDNVFCLKCYIPSVVEDEKLYNTLKVNYQEFEVEKYNDLYDEENAVYTCVVVLLHALLKCTNNKFRNQLSERMNDEEQVLLATFLEATQSSLFTKQNISDALMLINDTTKLNFNDSEIFSNDTTPVKSKTLRRSYLQEFCESPKSQSLIFQEKEKLIAKLTEDYKNECEENYKLTENIKLIQDLNTKLSNKLEDKNKVIQCLKDEIEEFSNQKESPNKFKVDNTLIITKLNQDILDLEINNNELKLQVTELENKNKDLNEKFVKKTADYENIILTFNNIETENISLKSNVDSFKEILQQKNIEIASLKDELNNKSISNNPMNSSCQETNVISSNTLYDELKYVKLEEVTHDKEKYRHKYKLVKKDLLNAENRIKDLDEQILIFKQKIYDCETHNDELNKKLSGKKKELQDWIKKNNNLESKINHLKDCIEDKENHIRSICTKLEQKENQLKEFSVEMDTIKKAKSMIELILSKTNAEIETLHEENGEYVKQLLTIIEDYKKSEELSHNNISNLENNIKKIQDDLVLKDSIIISNEQQIAKNCQVISDQEVQIRKMYQDNIMLKSSLTDMKTEIEKQLKDFNDKKNDMENCLEYYLDELKDAKNTKTKMEEILNCKKNEIDQQTELINVQKNIIETLQFEKGSQEININEIKNILDQKSIENINLKENIQESSLNLYTLQEQLKAVSNEKTMIENNLKIIEDHMKKSSEELQCQIYDMKNVLESQSNEIDQYKTDLEKLKDAFNKKQNDYNDQLIINNNQIEIISNLRLEKCEIEEKLKSSNQNLLKKENEVKSLEEMYLQRELEIKNLKEEINLKVSENCILTKNLDTTINNLRCDFDKQLEDMKISLQLYDDKIKVQTEKILKLKNVLNEKKNELEVQIDLKNKQNEFIITLETEKNNLLEKLNVLDQCLLNKDVEIVNLGKELQNRSLIIEELEEQLGVIRIEKIMIETNLNETAEQLKNTQEQFTENNNNNMIQLSNYEEKVIQFKNQCISMEDMLDKKQRELDEHLGLTLQLNDTFKIVKSEKEILEKKLANATAHSITTQADIKLLNDQLYEHKSVILKLEKELDTATSEKISIETRLKDTINQKEIINLEFSEKLKHMNDCLNYNKNKNNDLQNCLTDLTNDLNKKQIQLEQTIEENNILKEAVDYTKNRCIDLEDKLKDFNDSILKQDEIKKQLMEVKQILNEKHIELENQIKFCNEQKETIIKINCENESYCGKIQNLEDILSHKEYEFNLCEGKLYDCSNTINNLEKELNDVKNEKLSLELKLNETTLQITDISHDLIMKLEVKDKEILKIEENELKKQIEQSNEHLKTISFINMEKDTLIKDVNKLQEYLNEKDYNLNTLQENILEYIKQYEKLQSQMINLETEFNENKIQLETERQISKQKLDDMESKYDEIQNQFKIKEIELDKHIEKYNCQKEKINFLTSKIDNLINETNSLNNTLLDKDNLITSYQEKLLKCEEKNDVMRIKNVTLEIELKQANKELEMTHQELGKMNTQIKETEEQVEIITTLTSDKDNLINEINALKDQLLEKDNMLTSNHINLVNFEKQIKELQTQNKYLESEQNETKIQYDNFQHDFTKKLEMKKNKLCEVEELLIKLNIDLEQQKTFSKEQKETISSLIYEKKMLVDEMNTLKECLSQNNCVLASNQDKIQDYEKQNKEIECQNTLLKLELNQLKNLLQESTDQICEINKQLFETQEQLTRKQFEIEQQIEMKNNSLKTIYQKMHVLKDMKNKLELEFKKEKTIFETCLESYLNNTLNYINNKPIQDHHQDSLMEVITSADTFIEQNGIHLAQVVNCDEYSIIERLKKLFEALKMFIININTQGYVQDMIDNNTDNEYTISKETYSELLTKSNIQLETIKHLETEMSKLKAECNYKMTKIQQKTQEYVTSEYEKKFERKREQMKQFCKDLETKIHKDYEAKLMKYKEKINKDEIHIKEIGQQLWEVSEKYLRLQQNIRRESTMSLPFEMTTINQTTTNFPKYNSFSLPKSSSTSEIRSLVEEANRSNQDYSRRNVPAGIGKKFSLSSGKIYPKVEDEEGEMFDDSCLTDLKQGKVRLNDNDKQKNERLSELQARNSLCPPHLRSCYAVETNFLPNTSLITEEDIKTLPSYCDSESENLIPNDRKKKDRNQTSYKKPGPPTPSKNGGRNSLSGNTKIALKESKEFNVNKKRSSSTPNKLFSLFMSKKN